MSTPIRPLPILLAAALLAACGVDGPGASVATFELLSDGTGDAIVTRLPKAEGTRWLWKATQMQPNPAAPSVYGPEWFGERIEGEVDLGGQRVQVHRVHGDGLFLTTGSEARLYWGSEAGDFPAKPLVLLSLPLKVGRAWTTGTEESPKRYRFSVDDVERLETPAGIFAAARVTVLDTEADAFWVEWWADGVGLVEAMDQRWNDDRWNVVLESVSIPEAP